MQDHGLIDGLVVVTCRAVGMLDDFRVNLVKRGLVPVQNGGLVVNGQCVEVGAHKVSHGCIEGQVTSAAMCEQLLRQDQMVENLVCCASIARGHHVGDVPRMVSHFLEQLCTLNVILSFTSYCFSHLDCVTEHSHASLNLENLFSSWNVFKSPQSHTLTHVVAIVVAKDDWMPQINGECSGLVSAIRSLFMGLLDEGIITKPTREVIQLLVEVKGRMDQGLGERLASTSYPCHSLRYTRHFYKLP